MSWKYVISEGYWGRGDSFYFVFFLILLNIYIFFSACVGRAYRSAGGCGNMFGEGYFSQMSNLNPHNDNVHVTVLSQSCFSHAFLSDDRLLKISIKKNLKKCFENPVVVEQ